MKGFGRRICPYVVFTRFDQRGGPFTHGGCANGPNQLAFADRWGNLEDPRINGGTSLMASPLVRVVR